MKQVQRKILGVRRRMFCRGRWWSQGSGNLLKLKGIINEQSNANLGVESEVQRALQRRFSSLVEVVTEAVLDERRDWGPHWTRGHRGRWTFPPLEFSLRESALVLSAFEPLADGDVEVGHEV
ncbi:MAG: hypothetical protein M2R45_03856 [Verrucomicrobia subdivision 3 bacterium]|nr:hypothetical protein [Limisphaerales bacterium]MCS1415812.1 hypothetical protein [Limisphaerales bacterium]